MHRHGDETFRALRCGGVGDDLSVAGAITDGRSATRRRRHQPSASNVMSGWRRRVTRHDIGDQCKGVQAAEKHHQGAVGQQQAQDRADASYEHVRQAVEAATRR